MSGHDAPIKIQGWGCVFGVTYASGWQPGRLERIGAGAFDLVRREPFMALDHEPGRRLAWVRDHSMRVWQDSYGLGFEADLPRGHVGLSLARGIANGTFRGASMGSLDLDGSEIEDAVEDDQEVAVIHRLQLGEISITACPANGETAVWLDCEESEGLPPRIRQARSRWQVSNMAAQITKRPAATPKAPPQPSHRPDPMARALTASAFQARFAAFAREYPDMVRRGDPDPLGTISALVARHRPDLAEFWR